MNHSLKQFKNEGLFFFDKETGVKIHQITNVPSVHHHPFYYIPAFNSNSNYLTFISRRSGRPEIYQYSLLEKLIYQVTDQANISEWTLHPSYKGNTIFFTDPIGAWKINCETFKKDLILDFNDIQENNERGASIATTTLSHDDLWWVLPIKFKNHSSLYVVNTSNGAPKKLCQKANIYHPQFHPNDNSLIRYAGHLYDDRLWTINRDGSENKLIYNRKAKEWVVHEVWHPKEKDIYTVIWPHGFYKIDEKNNDKSALFHFNSWHANIDLSGEFVVFDTVYPDTGIHLYSIKKKTFQKLCNSNSSNQGEHWNTDHCPYDDHPIQKYPPQESHPHPQFSPDRKHVVYTSDITGFSQLYLAETEETILKLKVSI
jgi:oligogalacturonide lyase